VCVGEFACRSRSSATVCVCPVVQCYCSTEPTPTSATPTASPPWTWVSPPPRPFLQVSVHTHTHTRVSTWLCSHCALCLFVCLSCSQCPLCFPLFRDALFFPSHSSLNVNRLHTHTHTHTPFPQHSFHSAQGCRRYCLLFGSIYHPCMLFSPCVRGCTHIGLSFAFSLSGLAFLQ